jgi:hypothetical protein
MFLRFSEVACKYNDFSRKYNIFQHYPAALQAEGKTGRDNSGALEVLGEGITAGNTHILEPYHDLEVEAEVGAALDEITLVFLDIIVCNVVVILVPANTGRNKDGGRAL